MLIQSLYNFAAKTKTSHGTTILDSPEFESRKITWLIDIENDGTYIGIIPLIENNSGTTYQKLPRTLEPKDSGEISEFFVEDISIIMRLGETQNKPLTGKGLKKHQHFWIRIQNAYDDLNHPALMAILKWKNKCIDTERFGNPIYESFSPPKGKTKEQWVVVTTSGQKIPLYFRSNISIDATFRVDGDIIILDEIILNWWKRCFSEWLSAKEQACMAARGGGRVCAITGISDMAISNSHLPKIKRVPQALGVGASLASAEAGSFHSYGLSVQKAKIEGSKSAPDASYTNVSVKAAIAYCDALNYLLTNDDHHYSVDPVVFCFWCRDSTEGHRAINLVLNKAYPETVKQLFKTAYAGVHPESPANAERLYTVALSGNAGRIMIQQWIDQSLAEAVRNLEEWWDDLQIVPYYVSKGHKKTKNEKKKERSSPYSLYNLASATVRKSKKRKRDNPVSHRVVQLYTAALKNTSLSVSILKPILEEFQSALVKESEDNATYPLGQSRFAMIKLILKRITRNRKDGDFMPTYELADTPDPAYNLGRLLAVFEGLQDKYHNYEKKGAGVVERYYGAASSAPASAFPILCRLARHHLSKVRKEDGRAAYRIEERVTEILAKFQAETFGKPPAFPRILNLEQQGRFALGFYQQKAQDNLNKQSKKDETDNPENEKLEQ